MPRPKQSDGDSVAVRLAAELIQAKLEKTNKRYRSVDFQKMFSFNHSKCFKSLTRLKKLGFISAAKCGMETFYFLVSDSATHLAEIEIANKERAEAAKIKNRERQRLIDQEKTKKAQEQKKKAKKFEGSGLSKNCVLLSVRENPETRISTMRYLKYGETK